MYPNPDLNSFIWKSLTNSHFNVSWSKASTVFSSFSPLYPPKTQILGWLLMFKVPIPCPFVQPSWYSLEDLVLRFHLQCLWFLRNSEMNACEAAFLRTGSRPTLGPAIPFENLLPGNLCQSVDLFGTESNVSFSKGDSKILRNIDLTWFYGIISLCFFH